MASLLLFAEGVEERRPQAAVIRVLAVLILVWTAAVTHGAVITAQVVGPAAAERGDFTGDGRPDLIWQHPDTGAVLLWAMDGLFYAGSTILNSGGTYWKVVGSADLTGDGKADLLWQDPTTGALLLWIMDGPNYVGSSLLSPGGTYWRVVGVGDFTGDGYPDILWELRQVVPSVVLSINVTLLVWEMQGIEYIRSSIVSAPEVRNDQVVGVGDFTGDGHIDLLWQTPVSGSVYLWEMDGTTPVRSHLLSYGGPWFTYWRVVAVGDYTGDGHLDIVWQQPGTGALLLWEMDDANYVAATLLSPGGTWWQVKAPR